MAGPQDSTLVQQISTMRERTEQLVKGAFQSSDPAIIRGLQMAHALFCGLEARLRDGTALADGSSTSPMTKHDIEEIAAAVARKLDRGIYVVHETPRQPKRPS